MASIYDTVSNWDTNVSYNKFQPIKYNNKYYYSLIENNITNNPGISSNLQREGKEAFIYNPPTIYQKPNNQITTKYASVSWKSSYISYNIYNIEAGFVEVPA